MEATPVGLTQAVKAAVARNCSTFLARQRRSIFRCFLIGGKIVNLALWAIVIGLTALAGMGIGLGLLWLADRRVRRRHGSANIDRVLAGREVGDGR